jgi:hypothetical protein
MRLTYIACILALSSFFSACAPIPPAKPVKIHSPFDFEQTSKLLTKGHNIVKGSALLRQQGGGVVTCAGQEVQLIPVTGYSNERITAIYGNYEGGYNPITRQVIFEEENPLYTSLRLRTRCDAQGYFKFENVGDGQYFAVTGITWTVGNNPQGGSIAQKIQLQGGEVKEIVLTQSR